MSAAPVGTTLGVLNAVESADTTGTGTGGALTWTYTVDDAKVEYLAKGETKVESFTVTVDDGHGGLATRQVDITITGTNDAPVIDLAHSSVSAVLTERAVVTGSGVIQSAAGTAAFHDVDFADRRTPASRSRRWSTRMPRAW